MGADRIIRIPKLRSHTVIKPLSDIEITAFINELDTDNDGFVTFEELANAFKIVHAELVSKPFHEHMEEESAPHPSYDLEKGKVEKNREQDGIQEFLRSLMPDSGSSLSTDELKEHIKTWNVPSQDQNSADDQDQEISAYEQKLSLTRRARANWAIHGPKKLFRLFITALQLAFGFWQLMTYINKPKARAAFGWGVIVAKGSAGVLYPTFFFM
jgi:Ca2+-binding EF-hand superfamily protein